MDSARTAASKWVLLICGTGAVRTPVVLRVHGVLSRSWSSEEWTRCFLESLSVSEEQLDTNLLQGTDSSEEQRTKPRK